MALSDDAKNRLFLAIASREAGDEVTAGVQAGVSAAGQFKYAIAGAIVGTSTSTTTDFGALKAGDYVMQIPATAGNAQFLTVATAGTLPEAGIVGDLYVVLRPFDATA